MTQDRDRDRERGGDGGFDNIQQNYYQRGWGDHPDLHSHDGRSQASENHGKIDRTAICVIESVQSIRHYIVQMYQKMRRTTSISLTFVKPVHPFLVQKLILLYQLCIIILAFHDAFSSFL